MNKLTGAVRSQILISICEGNSLRATARHCDCAINTVVKLIGEIGSACSGYQDLLFRNLNCRVVKCQETWTFAGSKDKCATLDKSTEALGDAWTWTAIDADSKLMISWLTGQQIVHDFWSLIDDLADRLDSRIQLGTEGTGGPQKNVRLTFGPNVDYWKIVNVYGRNFEFEKQNGPSNPIFRTRFEDLLNPDNNPSSVTNKERYKLHVRLGCQCQHIRHTKDFSKKIEHYIAAFSLHAMFYNFCCPLKSLTEQSVQFGKNKVPTTPAMAAGFADHAWRVDEMIQAVQNTNSYATSNQGALP